MPGEKSLRAIIIRLQAISLVLLLGGLMTKSWWEQLPWPYPTLIVALMIKAALFLTSSSWFCHLGPRRLDKKLRKLGETLGTDDIELLEKIAHGVVEEGMSHERVVAALGAPDEVTGDSAYEILFYDNGDWRLLVILTGGIVSAVVGDCLLSQRDEAIRCRESGSGFPRWGLE